MKKTLILTIYLISSSAFARSIEGQYLCDDQGVLVINQKDLNSYYASLTYNEGVEASTLEVIDFKSSDSLIGTMYPDDEGKLGRAIITQNGLILKFNSGEVVTCAH